MEWVKAGLRTLWPDLGAGWAVVMGGMVLDAGDSWDDTLGDVGASGRRRGDLKGLWSALSVRRRFAGGADILRWWCERVEVLRS